MKVFLYFRMSPFTMTCINIIGRPPPAPMSDEQRKRYILEIESSSTSSITATTPTSALRTSPPVPNVSSIQIHLPPSKSEEQLNSSSASTKCMNSCTVASSNSKVQSNKGNAMPSLTSTAVCVPSEVPVFAPISSMQSMALTEESNANVPPSSLFAHPASRQSYSSQVFVQAPAFRPDRPKRCHDVGQRVNISEFDQLPDSSEKGYGSDAIPIQASLLQRPYSVEVAKYCGGNLHTKEGNSESYTYSALGDAIDEAEGELEGYDKSVGVCPSFERPACSKNGEPALSVAFELCKFQPNCVESQKEQLNQLKQFEDEIAKVNAELLRIQQVNYYISMPHQI